MAWFFSSLLHAILFSSMYSSTFSQLLTNCIRSLSPDDVLEPFAIWQHPYLLSLLAMHEVFQPVEICNNETWWHCSTYKQRVGNLQCQNKCKVHNEMFITLFRFITVLWGTDSIPCKQMQGAQWNVHNISYIHKIVSCGTISIPCSIFEYSHI